MIGESAMGEGGDPLVRCQSRMGVGRGGTWPLSSQKCGPYAALALVSTPGTSYVDCLQWENDDHYQKVFPSLESRPPLPLTTNSLFLLPSSLPQPSSPPTLLSYNSLPHPTSHPNILVPEQVTHRSRYLNTWGSPYLNTHRSRYLNTHRSRYLNTQVTLPEHTGVRLCTEEPLTGLPSVVTHQQYPVRVWHCTWRGRVKGGSNT